MPLISVVIPIFNTERYLEACLLSIMDQTFSDFEVICVDDLSTDRSREIVEDMVRMDPRIRLMCLDENRGIGGARNAGLAEVKSAYVAFFDSDDYIDPDMFQLLYAGTEEETFDVVICGHRTVDNQGHVLDQHVPQKRKIVDAHKMKDRLLLANPSPWNKLWRKSLFLDNKITFPTGVHWEDLATIPRLLLKARSINFIDRICYNYVDRSGSESSVASDGHIMDFLRAFDVLKDFLLAEGIYAEEKHNLDKLVTINYGWYAGRQMAKKTANAAKMRQYAKYCVLLASSYINLDDRFRGMDSAELIQQISAIGALPSPQPLGWLARLRNFASTFAFPRKPA